MNRRTLLTAVSLFLLLMPPIAHAQFAQRGGIEGTVFDLIGREFGGNNYVSNLYLCHVAYLESKWILFDPGLPTGSPSFPTGKVLPVAVVPTGTHEKVTQMNTRCKFSDRRTLVNTGEFMQESILEIQVEGCRCKANTKPITRMISSE